MISHSKIRKLIVLASIGMALLISSATFALVYYRETNDSGTKGDYTANIPKESLDSTWITAKHNGIWLFGDSITVADAYSLAVLLDERHQYTVAVFAQGGAPTRAIVDYAIERKAKSDPAVPPELIVMATGSNDIFYPEIMPSQIKRMKETYPDSKIIWVTTWVQRKTVSTAVQFADARNSGRVNGAILGGNEYVVDWGRFLAEKSGRAEAYLSDGVHTNLAGQAARNELIRQKIQQVMNLP